MAVPGMPLKVTSWLDLVNSVAHDDMSTAQAATDANDLIGLLLIRFSLAAATLSRRSE